MLRGFILAVHVLLAFMIVILVLLQRGKGAEAGAGFGSGASGTVFGARGTSTLFSRLTAAFAAAFFVTSLALAYVGTRVTTEPSTLLERRAAQALTEPQIPSAPVTGPVTAPVAGTAPVPAPATVTAPVPAPTPGGQQVSSVPLPAQPAPAAVPTPAPAGKP